MPKRGIAILFCAALFGVLSGSAGAEVNDRLAQEHFGIIVPGDYQAGDHLRFSLTRYQTDRFENEFLMHIAGQPEVYVLYADYASLGGRVLKFDSGAIAIQVAGWGNMTIYTDESPEGLPAVRMGDAQPPFLPQISLPQIQSVANDEAEHLSYSRGVRVSFAVDWGALAGDPNLRAIVFDALENTARAIDRFTANPAARSVFQQRVSAISMQESDRPIIRIMGKTLIVTYNPRQNYAGRASSRAISYAMGKMFGVPMPN